MYLLIQQIQKTACTLSTATIAFLTMGGLIVMGNGIAMMNMIRSLVCQSRPSIFTSVGCRCSATELRSESCSLSLLDEDYIDISVDDLEPKFTEDGYEVTSLSHIMLTHPQIIMEIPRVTVQESIMGKRVAPFVDVHISCLLST